MLQNVSCSRKRKISINPPWNSNSFQHVRVGLTTVLFTSTADGAIQCLRSKWLECCSRSFVHFLPSSWWRRKDWLHGNQIFLSLPLPKQSLCTHARTHTYYSYVWLCAFSSSEDYYITSGVSASQSLSPIYVYKSSVLCAGASWVVRRLAKIYTHAP